MTKEGFECYKLYLAMQRHFSSSYDFFQYNGKVKANSESYSKRPDVFAFEKLAKIIPNDELIDFFLPHFLENPKEWIRNMTKGNLERYRATIKNLPTKFREDLQRIKMEGPQKVMAVGGDIPLIHRLAIKDEISIETLILIDWLVPFIDDHAERVAVPFVFPEHIKKLQNYRPFLKKKLEKNYNYYVDCFRTEMVGKS